ncbi:MAG: hypothetical protein R3C42_07255 [Parvularculaceae bacterium]
MIRRLQTRSKCSPRGCWRSNVYYFETQTPYGRLRSKYALLSIEAFRRLAGPETFHSYFWARFAQPSRLVTCPADGESELFRIVCGAIETFLVRSQGLAENPQDWREVWLKGMNASYRAELRAANSDRAAKLIASYGDWPQRTAAFALRADADGKNYGTIIAWKARAVFGAVLSVARLLKATTTFQGGIDYIAWKIKRHSGVDIAVKPWERKHPFIAAPIVAIRYYRLRADASKAVET